MTSVGDTWRRERLQRKLDLDQVSHELKISRKMLDAIEADQFERLPGSIFAKAFVRQYAGMLGLDGEALASQVQRTIEPPSLTISEKGRPAVTPIEVPRVEEWNSVGDKGFRLSGSLPAAALVVVVMLICSAVYAWLQRPRTAPVVRSNPPVAARTEPAQQPAAPVQATQTPPPVESPAQQPVASAPTVETPSAAPPQPEASAQSAPAPQSQKSEPVAPGPVHVEVVADEAVWVQARVDGKFVFAAVMDPNTRRVLDGANEVVLRLGNAGGVTILLNGKPIGSAGPKGQVRTLQLTSGGFQIVPPKPAAPAAPLDPLDR
jgi:cytoskeleton protein RodZ